MGTERDVCYETMYQWCRNNTPLYKQRFNPANNTSQWGLVTISYLEHQRVYFSDSTSVRYAQITRNKTDIAKGLIAPSLQFVGHFAVGDRHYTVLPVDISRELKKKRMELTPEQVAQYYQRVAHCANMTGENDGDARRDAKKAGLRITKARGRCHLNNCGGYQLLDERNNVVAGADFTLNAQDVIEYCLGITK